jgi:hypothetical protein
MAMMETSEPNAELLQKEKVSQNGTEASSGEGSIRLLARENYFGCAARRRTAFQCVYGKYVRNGAGIFKHKKNFFNTVLEPYKLINETAKQAGSLLRLYSFI